MKASLANKTRLIKNKFILKFINNCICDTSSFLLEKPNNSIPPMLPGSKSLISTGKD